MRIADLKAAPELEGRTACSRTFARAGLRFLAAVRLGPLPTVVSPGKAAEQAGYLPTRCWMSRLFSWQMYSINSWFGAQVAVVSTVHGLV